MAKPMKKVKSYNPDDLGFFQRHFIVPIKRYFGLCEKEVRTLLKDRAAMMISFAIPIIVILILTVGVDQNLLSETETGVTQDEFGDDFSKAEIPNIGIINADSSEGACFGDRDLSDELEQKFIERAELGKCYLLRSTNQSELELLLGIGELNAFIVIPELFEFNLSIHLPVILPFVLDSIDIQRLQTAQVVVDEVIQEFRIENNFTGVFQTEKHNVNLPKQSQTYFAAAPFFVPLIIFGIGCLVSTQSIVSDIPKDRMVLTPTNKREMMAAKVTGNFLVMMILSLIILASSAIAQLQIRSTWWEFLLVCAILSLNAVLFGVALSAISKTPLAAFQFFIFLFLFQAVILLFVEDPIILNLMPIYGGNILILNVVLRGQSLWSVRENILYIVYESIAIYMGAYYVFKAQKTML